MPAHDPLDRATIAQIAAHTRWATTPDRTTATAPARAAFDERFTRQVDPEGVLAPELRATLAANARRAYFLSLARKSAAARRSR